MRHFALHSSHWLGALVLTLVAAASGANAQGTLNVSASASSTDWAAVSTDENPSTLSASVNNPPTAVSGCTLNPPNWSWVIETTGNNQVQYSPDNISWSASGGFSAWIIQPEPTLPTAYLHVIFMIGGYWQFPCRTSVSYSDTCGTTWSGTALAMADPKSVKLLSLTVTSGATQTDVTGATNWAAVKTAAVGVKVLLQATIQPADSEAAKKIEWTGGSEAAPGNNTRRTVDKGTSAMSKVTAQIGPDQYSVNIWILWATIVNQVTGITPANAVQFGANFDGTENLGVQAYNDGNTARGKVIPIATVTPAGVNAVLTGGFAFRRDKLRHDFQDGAKVTNRYDNAWQTDNSDRRSQAPPKTDDDTKPLALDADDKCYDLDAPNIDNFGQTYSFERYDNYREYLLWHGQTCSDYEGWYFAGVWVKNDTGKNQVKLDVTAIGQGGLDLALYLTSKYPPP